MSVAAGQPGGASMSDALRRKRFRHANEAVIRGLLLACAIVSLVASTAIVIVLFEGALTFFREIPVGDFLFGTEWQPLFNPVSYGIWELVAGTLNVVLWSMLFALPLGLGAAIYLSEYAQPKARRVLKPMLEALAGVPTVVYAYFALTFISIDILIPLLGERAHLCVQRPRGEHRDGGHDPPHHRLDLRGCDVERAA